MSTEPESTDPGEAAMAALEDWGRRNASIDGELVKLAAAAWHAGALGRNITKYAEAAGVDRRRIYGALTSAGIDYKNKGTDRHVTRLLTAVTALSAALAPGARTPELFWKTSATLNPLIGNALLALAGGVSPNVPPAVNAVLTAVDQLVPEDREALQPQLRELGEAFAMYMVRPSGVRPSPRPGNPLLRAATRPAGRLPADAEGGA